VSSCRDLFRIRNIINHRTPPKLSLLTLLVRRDTPLKKKSPAVAVSVFAVLMVLPVVRSVNLSAGKPVTIDQTLRADGSPQPPFPPKSLSMSTGTLVADGSPQPPFPPKSLSMSTSTLVADGSPQPSFPPQASQMLVIV
jgi:hypothetical protein